MPFYSFIIEMESSCEVNPAICPATRAKHYACSWEIDVAQLTGRASSE